MILGQGVARRVKIVQVLTKFTIWDCAYAMLDFSELRETAVHVRQARFTMRLFMTVRLYVVKMKFTTQVVSNVSATYLKVSTR